MKKWWFGIILLLFLTGCEENFRYGDQVNSQNMMDASRVQNEIINDTVRNANPILSLLMNGEANTFTRSQLEGLLTTEMERTQDALERLEKYRQPDHLEDEITQTFQALANYKSSLLFLREKIKTDADYAEEEKQFIAALNTLQSSHFVKP